MVLARLHRGWNEDWVFICGEAFETIRPLARAPALASAVLVAIMPCLRGLTYYIQTPLEWRVDAKGEEEGPQQGGDRVDSPLRPSPGCCWHTAQRARSFALSLARFPSLKPPQTSSCLSLPPVLMPLNLRFRCATLAPQRMSMYSCHTVPRNFASLCPPHFSADCACPSPLLALLLI
jgi:hypothetical protein